MLAERACLSQWGNAVSDRFFRHQFLIDDDVLWDGILSLSTTQIAEAAIQEIIQLSLSASPFDLFLDQLLNPATGWFQWIGNLGQIRETRTALSGLFGRFIARAYLTEAWGYAHFHPLHAPVTPVGPHTTAVQTQSGDLPDWLISPDITSSFVAIAEAKGSHNVAGPWSPLKAAMTQAERVSLYRGSTELVTKRFAIATRWAVHGHPKLAIPWLVVDDPDKGDDEPTIADFASIRRGIALGHYAALARGLGMLALEDALLTARERPPGLMILPVAELVSVEREDNQQFMAAGIFARSGLIPIPLAADTLDLGNLADTFGGEAMLVGITKDRLLEADRIGLSDKDKMLEDTQVHESRAGFYARQHRDGRFNPAYDDRKQSTEDIRAHFWTDMRTGAGGFEFMPLKGLRLRRFNLLA